MWMMQWGQESLRLLSMPCLEITGHNARVRHCEGVVVWFISKYLPRHKLTSQSIIVDYCVRVCSVGVLPKVDLDLVNLRLSYTTAWMWNYILELFARELWHVYQHVTGNLKRCGKKPFGGIDHSDTDYSDQPWEIEAEEMEEILIIFTPLDTYSKTLYNTFCGG